MKQLRHAEIANLELHTARIDASCQMLWNGSKNIPQVKILMRELPRVQVVEPLEHRDSDGHYPSKSLMTQARDEFGQGTSTTLGNDEKRIPKFKGIENGCHSGVNK